MTTAPLTRGPAADIAGRLAAAAAALVVLLLCASAGISAGTQGFGTSTLLRVAVIMGGLLALLWITRFEFFVVAVLLIRPVLDVAIIGGGPPVLASGLAAFIVLGVVVWLAAQLHARSLRRVSVLGRLAVLLLAAMSVSALASDDRVRSTLQVARLAAAVALFLAVEQLVPDVRRRRLVLTACFASAVVPLLVGVYQFLSGNYLHQADGLGRVTGTFVHPNAFGFYLVLVITMGAAVLRHLTGGAKLLVGAVLLGSAAELLLTYSRGSWACMVVALLVVGALQARKLLLLVPLGLALVPVLAPTVLVRLADLSQTQTVNGTPGNSFFWRLDHWSVILRAARGHALIGLGPGSSDFLGDTVLPPHNDFVRMYVETGVVGTAIYVALILAALAAGWRALRGSGLRRGLAVGAVACTVAFVVDSIGGNLITQVPILLLLFTFLATAADPTTERAPARRLRVRPARAPGGRLALPPLGRPA